jgi:hypothetical protein
MCNALSGDAENCDNPTTQSVTNNTCRNEISGYMMQGEAEQKQTAAEVQ